MKKLRNAQYPAYQFAGRDPIIDSIGTILEYYRGRGMKMSELAADSGVSYSTLCQLRRTAMGTGMIKYHSRRVYYQTAAAILRHLDQATILLGEPR